MRSLVLSLAELGLTVHVHTIRGIYHFDDCFQCVALLLFFDAYRHKPSTTECSTVADTLVSIARKTSEAFPYGGVDVPATVYNHWTRHCRVLDGVVSGGKNIREKAHLNFESVADLLFLIHSDCAHGGFLLFDGEKSLNFDIDGHRYGSWSMIDFERGKLDSVRNRNASIEMKSQFITVK